MVALDKIYFSPLGKFMDDRDAAIREKLSSVKDTSSKVKQLEEQANAVMRASRAEISAALNKMKKETQLEVEQKIAEGRLKVDAELQEALANLEKQKEEETTPGYDLLKDNNFYISQGALQTLVSAAVLYSDHLKLHELGW